MERARGQLFWWVAAAALAALAAVHFLGGSEPPPLPAPVAVRAASDAGGGGAAPYVHVAGRVRRPGLYRLRRGARVAAAIERAGGPAGRADLSKVNLAARVEDGQQVLVPRAGAVTSAAAGAPAEGAASAGTTGSAAAKLSLAAATVEQLDGLDGIGPTLAKRIVDYRDAHGGFRSLGQLREVEGIGEKRFKALREAVGP